MIWFVYLSFTGLAALVAWKGIWPLPLERELAVALGAVILLAGFSVVMAGMAEFGSVRRASGRECPGLVRSGIYRFTRNPQNVGWGVGLLGIALMGRSGLALLFGAIFFLAFRLYAPIEERYLEGLFGEEWRSYEQSVPRFILPKRAPRPEPARSGGWLSVR
jgi:protein-S-isoprenylcysteine O-methyltransferase Ste14